MSDLDARLSALTPAQRALFEARLRARGLDAPRSRTIRPIPGRQGLTSFATSLDQERLWFIDQMEPGNPAYNIHSASRLYGPIDPDLMGRAVNASIARHEILRTTFRVMDGRPVQVVAPALEIDVPVVDLTRLPGPEREAAALREAVEAAAVRFDLERGPLVRVRLARLGPEDHVLMMCMHHAVTDRWSFDIFEREISQVYVALRDGGAADLPPLPIQFADFAAWQREELSGERLDRHLAYWRERLAGVPLVLEIPTDRPRPPVQTFTGGREYIVYPDALLAALKDLTHRANATMFMTVLAALDVLCWKYAAQRDLIVGSAIADRNRPETENVIGYFLNMLLLRATIDPARSFADLLAQVRATALGAYAHQDVPFATLVAELKPRQDPGRNPLIQVSFIYLDFPVLETPEYAGLSSSPMDVDNGAARFDMTLACTELPGTGIHSYIEYNSDLYEQEKVRRMLRHLGRILEFAARRPDRPLRELDLLDPEERAALVVGPNRTERPYPDACLHELVARAAAEAPQRAAIVLDGEVTTRGELGAAAGRLARRLRGLGVGPGSLVPVCAASSREQAVALLAVLEAGAAYVPLDAALPAARLESMLADCRPRIVLAQQRLASAVPAGPWRLLEIETASGEAGGADAPDAAVAVPPDDLAYVMFTSGSTGAPKGVMVTHRAIVNRLRWAQERHPLRPDDSVLHNASFGFDIAAWELFGSLAAGATVVVPREGEHKDPAALAVLMRDEGVTVAHFVPSMLRPVLEEPALAACGSLRAVFCGGEGMGRDLHDRFFETLPGRALAHFYGPTEAAISCLSWDCDPSAPPGPPPIGRPIANMRVHLLDETLHAVPAGVPGEICIGGTGLARGYLARPDLTAERFVPDPVSGRPGERLYRTGDVARRREDGAMEFLGRSDHQVKIRGYRIEPGEIESVLLRVPGVAETVAVARGQDRDRRLVAYIVPGGAAPEGLPDETALRAALRRTLPDYMVPSAFVVLERLPLGPTGKLDRAALPEPGAPAPGDGYVAPRTPAEEIVAGIWAALLRRDRVGAEDDFFDLGGDSLLATQVVSRVRAAFEVEFPLRRFFEGSTVAALAAAVEDLLVEKLEAMSEEEVAGRLSRDADALQRVGDGR